MATHPQLTRGRKFVFRTCFDDDRQAELLARFIYQRRHLKRGAILFNRNFSYSTGFKTAFERAYGDLGGKIVAIRSFSNESDIDRVAMGELETVSPEFIILPSYQLEAAALLAKLSRTLPSKVQYFGPDSWGGGAYFKPVFSGAAEQVTAFYADHWAKEVSLPANREFLANYRRHLPSAVELQGQETPTLSNIVSHYEVARFILRALQGQKPGEPLVSSIRRTVFHGPRGTVAFRSSNSSAHPIRIFKIEPMQERFVTSFGDVE
jgi:branched-chain amino acid transport system substrate-binding protein